MSKLAHSNEETMYQIELQNRLAENPGSVVCKQCGGTGAVPAPWSGSDPSCSKCDGEGVTYA